MSVVCVVDRYTQVQLSSIGAWLYTNFHHQLWHIFSVLWHVALANKKSCVNQEIVKVQVKEHQ